jgi:Helix-turn-helix domain
MSITLEQIASKLEENNRLLRSLLEKNTIKEFYSPKEFATIVERNDDYVRELCRKGRLNHKRTQSGRGGKAEIRIPHAELLRFQAEGLLSQ